MLDRLKRTSRFIGEIDSECIEHVGLQEKTNTSESKSMSGNAYIRSNTWQNANIEKNSVSKRRGALRKGDRVRHQAFGEGIVVSISDGLATIAFEHKFGIRKIQQDHPSIEKIKK